ncbi:hypothetical protein BKA64DRAFT_680789 [Cadophora sp. MPI-SDFR-AT-0126]|nr:hypothetical protein BKA64DRAFT_680789 [Leotiomycetes sp. MPI-SDFR-AT-0126]
MYLSVLSLMERLLDTSTTQTARLFSPRWPLLIIATSSISSSHSFYICFNQKLHLHPAILICGEFSSLRFSSPFLGGVVCLVFLALLYLTSRFFFSVAFIHLLGHFIMEASYQSGRETEIPISCSRWLLFFLPLDSCPAMQRVRIVLPVQCGSEHL